MKSGFAFRRLLPILQVLIFLGVLIVGHALQTVRDAQIEISRLAHPQPENIVGWDLRSTWDGNEIPGLRLALLISLPAILPIIPVALLLPEGTVPDPVAFVLFAFSIACLWYLVGFWLDRRLGFAPFTPRIPSLFWRCVLLVLLALLLAAMALLLFACSMLPFDLGLLPWVAFLFAWLSFATVVIMVAVRGWWILGKQKNLPQGC